MPKLFDEKHNRCFTKNIRADTSLIDKETRTVPVIMVSNDNGGLRYDWRTGKYFIEELDPNGADMSELNSLFKDHSPSTDNVLGRVINKRIEDNQNKADVVFGSKPSSQTVFTDYAEENLTDFSIGYDYDEKDVEVTDRKVDGYPVWVIRKYRILELSTVWKGFDKGATVGRSADATEEEEKIEEAEDQSGQPSKVERELIGLKLKIMQKEIL